MHTFKDAKGDEWSIELDTSVAREIRKELGVDLLSLDEGTVAKLVSDDEALVDVISFICTEQIKRRELDARGFAGRLVGEAIDDACDALVQEVVFISRRSRKQVVAKAWEKIKAAEERLMTEGCQVLDSGVIERQTDQAIREMRTQLGAS